jgi:Phycobilisome protein
MRMLVSAFVPFSGALPRQRARETSAAHGASRSTQFAFRSVASPRHRFTCMHSNTTPQGYARENVVQDGSASPLPERVKDLIAAQVGRPIYDTTSPSAPACTVAAQGSDPPRFLTEEECADLGSGGLAAGFLRDSRDEIVAMARRQVTVSHPGIDEPGGALYPSFRAEACWRDLTNFVRVASYGCVCMSASNDSYLNAEGCKIMNAVYDELEVPRLALLTGVRACSDSACEIFSGGEEEPKLYIKRAFDELVNAMSKMGDLA